MRCKDCGYKMTADKRGIVVCPICKTSSMPKKEFYKRFGLDSNGKPPKISEKRLRGSIKEMQEMTSYSFFCAIKGRKITFMTCFRCFDSPEENKCSIMQNAIAEQKKTKKRGKAQLREKVKVQRESKQKRSA